MNVNELPQYKCHKVVRAGKISAIETDIDKGLLMVSIVGISQPFVFPSRIFRMRSAEIGGYLVVYEDVHVSYSPAEPFEAGYHRLDMGSSSGSTPPAEASGLKSYTAMDGSVVHAGAIREWLYDEMEGSVRIRVDGCAELFVVPRPDGNVPLLRVGDILLNMPDGSFRLMSPHGFHQTYKPCEPEPIDLEAADFSDALMWLKEGKRVQRTGWNGDGQFVEKIEAERLVFKGDGKTELVSVGEFLMLNDAQGNSWAWHPSSADLMADDWKVVS